MHFMQNGSWFEGLIDFLMSFKIEMFVVTYWKREAIVLYFIVGL